MILQVSKRRERYRRVGGLSGHEPHISDLRTPFFAKLTPEPHISGKLSRMDPGGEIVRMDPGREIVQDGSWWRNCPGWILLEKLSG